MYITYTCIFLINRLLYDTLIIYESLMWIIVCYVLFFEHGRIASRAQRRQSNGEVGES